MNEHPIPIETREIIALLSIIAIIITLPLLFKADETDLTGQVISTVNVTGWGDRAICNFTLSPGWNLVSFNCIRNFWTVPAVFNPINTSIISSFRYDPTAIFDKWESYNPSLPSWVVQDLNDVRPEFGYWINVANQSQYELNASYINNTNIPLVIGWNQIGYPTKNYSVTMASGFSSINGNYSEVRMYNASENRWYVYYPTGPNSTITILVPEFGYWINATDNITWVVDW